MFRKYGLFIAVFIILLAGFIVTLLNKYYTLDYLYNSLIKRDFAVNPRVDVNPDRVYEVRIWYFPFGRTIDGLDEKEFFRELKRVLQLSYPNIRLFTGKVDFATGHKKLMEAIEEGVPPDIFFNLSDDFLINEKLQLPVSPYILDLEKESYYTVNWNRISHRDRLWGWPVYVQEQSWIASKAANTGKYSLLAFGQKLAHLKENSLLLNYYDDTLLKQLLTLTGIDTFKVENGHLDIDTYRALEEVFEGLYSLREKKILYKGPDEAPDIFLKELMEGKEVVIGPVNPYLKKFIDNKLKGKIEYLKLDNLVQTYYLNIFRQKKYKGDDHTRAVMEVARILSQQTAPAFAEKMGLKRAYSVQEEREGKGQVEGEVSPVREILVIHPDYKEYWEGVLFPAWLEFWESELTPEEVMDRL
ncbi:MAG: hypothetical protein GX175_06120 [Halanaerobiaceae bacterium]|nr:hypothetical protein [Halanaerobiaceae bacterium]